MFTQYDSIVKKFNFGNFHTLLAGSQNVFQHDFHEELLHLFVDIIYTQLFKVISAKRF